MYHTYLFEEGTWWVHGHSLDANGVKADVVGTSTIVHQRNAWLKSGEERIEGDVATVLNHFYEFVPFIKDEMTTIWSAKCPIFGRLKGRCVLAGDSFVLTFESLNGLYAGSEFIKKLSNHQYYKRGSVVGVDGEALSWSMQLSN